MALGAGAHRPVPVPSSMYQVPTKYQGAFAKQIGNRARGPRTPRPPPGLAPRRRPSVLGFLVLSPSAERGGLPTTRNLSHNWPFRCPLPPTMHPTSPPQVMPKAQGNVSRQLAGAVVLGAELHPHPHAARGALLSFECEWRVPKKIARRAVPRPSGAVTCGGGHGRGGLATPTSPVLPGGGGQEEQSRCLHTRSF
jgi:hypothetical protein